MCCYVRHLRAHLAGANLPDDRAGRREADRRVRAALGMPEADCPGLWRRVKALSEHERAALLALHAAPPE